MELPTLATLLVGLSIYSWWFVRRVAFTQAWIMTPFYHRVHAPKAMAVLTEPEHRFVHERLDIFNLRAFLVYFAALIGVACAAFFFALVYYEGNASIPGYIMAFAFAFIFANYNMNSTFIGWTRACENELLARVLQNDADAGGFNSLGEYLQAENQKMMQEWFEDVSRIGQEFEDRMIELGWDPERDYYENSESEEELAALLEQVQNEFAEKYPEHAEK